MDWKYCRGLDGKPHPDYAGSARFLRIVLPVLTVILLGLLLWLARFPDLKGRFFPLILYAPLLCWSVYSILVGFWYTEKYRIGPAGMELKWLLGRRTVRRENIRAARIYDVYWGSGRNIRKGGRYILAFLDPDRRPREMHGNVSCFRQRDGIIMLYASEENLCLFQAFYGQAPEPGTQKGMSYTLWTGREMPMPSGAGWRLCHGRDEQDCLYYGLALVGCVLLPLLFLSLVGFVLWEIFSPASSGIFRSSAGWIFLPPALFVACIMGRFSGLGFWSWEKYRIDGANIRLKWLFGRRTVPRSAIQAAALYNVYYTRDSRPRPFIVVFLDVKKTPWTLDDDSIYLKRRTTVILRATEESIREFEAFYGRELRTGRQNGNQWAGKGISGP